MSFGRSYSTRQQPVLPLPRFSCWAAQAHARVHTSRSPPARRRGGRGGRCPRRALAMPGWRSGDWKRRGALNTLPLRLRLRPPAARRPARPPAVPCSDPGPGAAAGVPLASAPPPPPATRPHAPPSVTGESAPSGGWAAAGLGAGRLAVIGCSAAQAACWLSARPRSLPPCISPGAPARAAALRRVAPGFGNPPQGDTGAPSSASGTRMAPGSASGARLPSSASAGGAPAPGPWPSLAAAAATAAASTCTRLPLAMAHAPGLSAGSLLLPGLGSSLAAAAARRAASTRTRRPLAMAHMPAPGFSGTRPGSDPGSASAPAAAACSL